MSPRIRTNILCVLLVACAAVLASGCTARQGDEEYADRLGRALTVRNEVVQQLDGDKLGDERGYREAASRVRGALEELDADAPPKRYDRAHEVLVGALDGLSVLLGKLGRCEALEKTARQDARACRQAIGQDVFDTLRDDFRESDAIYRTEGLSLPQLGGEDEQSGSGGGDVLDAPAGGDGT